MDSSDRFADLCGQRGRSLLRDHLNGDPDATRRLGLVVEAVCDGVLDDQLRAEPHPDHVYVTTSAHLMTLAVMNRYNGTTGTDLYKGDPLRYVRLNFLIQRLLGIERLTVGTPVYAFGAESLGQLMMYPDDQAPGSDPGSPLVAIDGWRDMPGYNPDHPVTRIVRETAVLAGEVAGTDPLVHLPAPYSLAAEIFGQEQLINALNTEPDTVRDLLNHLTEVVLAPWCEDLAKSVPDVWLELSDASGSPMFIGPHNFLSFAVEPVRQLIGQPGWGERVFVANYRGDSPPRATTRGRRRNTTPGPEALTFDELLAAKIDCCPFFVTRLEADAASERTYADAAIRNGIALYLGIGAVRLDRNSTPDQKWALQDLYNSAFERASLIHTVRAGIGYCGDSAEARSWPGDLYIEDTNGETDVDLLAAVLDGFGRGQHHRGRILIAALRTPRRDASARMFLVLMAAITVIATACSSPSSDGTAGPGSGEIEVVLDGLDNPRGVVVISATEFYLTEAGTGNDPVDQTQNTGKLTHFKDLNDDGDFDDADEVDRWFSLLPSYNALSFFGSGRDEVSGPSDVLLHRDGRIFLAVDGGFDEQDLFEISPDRRVGRSLASRSNMNSIAFDLDQTSIYAVESAANRLIELPLDGELREIVTFPDLANGQQAVPAGVAVDPLTGEILVALFSGNAVDPETDEVTPFVLGDSKVVRVDPTTGAVTDEITGLTVAVDVAVDELGNIYIVELASEPADILPGLFDLFDPDGPALHGGYRRFTGRVTLYPANGGPATVIADGLDLPTNITIGPDHSLYVSTGQGTPGRPIPGPEGPTRIVGKLIRISNFSSETLDPGGG